MIPLDGQQAAARQWFENLRDRICSTFESIEREAGSEASFSFTPWNRDNDPEAAGGGGVQGLMKGRVFEKVGVNVSTVGGVFSGDFAKTIHGAGEIPDFFATGISLVAHMANPHVPAVHMNTRFLVTQKRWFGGGAFVQLSCIRRRFGMGGVGHLFCQFRESGPHFVIFASQVKAPHSGVVRWTRLAFIRAPIASLSLPTAHLAQR